MTFSQGLLHGKPERRNSEGPGFGELDMEEEPDILGNMENLAFLSDYREPPSKVWIGWFVIVSVIVSNL